MKPRLHSLFALLMAIPLAAEVIPVNLPANDEKPPAKDKPVKVFILSGQSNALGFGRIGKSTPLYSSVYLSADPSAIATKLPVDNAALLPLKINEANASVYAGKYEAGMELTKLKPGKTEKVALGTVAENLPSMDGDHFVIVNASFEVPYDGNYEIHAGMGENQGTILSVDGKPFEAKATLTKSKSHTVSIAYQAGGGSAAFWMQMVDLEGMGDLEWVVKKLGRFPYLMDKEGNWTARNDVQLNDAYMGKGKTAPHGPEACGSTFGPELGFGYVLGTYLDEPVIVMKADIGNRSLGWDILPPGSERYTFEGKEYPGYGEEIDADGNIQKFDGEGWYAGKQYDEYTAAIHNVLDNFGEKYPEYADQGYEVAGFFWWQGHKDGPNPAHNSRYEQNLVNLIKAWRKEFNAPEAKWAIATVGFDGENMPEHYQQIAQAQRNVADPKLHPELAGTVKTIETVPFWRGPEVSPKNQNYHYNHNAETYMLVGDALGRAMVELLGGKVEYPPAKVEKDIEAVPFMQQATGEEVEAMTSALKPIMLDKVIPDYIGSSEGVPGYRRYGMPLTTIAANTPPEEKRDQKSLKSQLDMVINYYNLAGIHDYDWKPFIPDMQTAEWNYHTFDPKEPRIQDAKGNWKDMYREVTLPSGMDNWYSSDFDPAKSGWKTGKAPFGQNNGELQPLISSCSIDYCGCNIMPATLWDKEVLLMRQTFNIPEFKEGHRYRINVGGAGHAWSGEGFALYLDGKLIQEIPDAYYKGGGDARGAYIFDNIMPEFKDGKATIGVKAFLRRTGHRGKLADPRGHISVWIQEAKLPPAVEGIAAQAE